MNIKTAFLKPFASNESGQSIVELAIVSPLLIMLMVGAVDVGTFMYGGIEVGNGARAGVHYGSQSIQTAADVAGIGSAASADAQQISGFKVTNAATYCVCDSNQGVTVSCTQTSPVLCPSPDRRDIFLKVTAATAFTPLLHYPGLPSKLTITRTAIQQIVD